MEDLKERLAAAEQRTEAAKGRKARAEVQRDTAKTNLTAAKQALVDEFQIATSDDIRRVRAELESELETAVAEAEQALQEAGA